MTAPLTDAQIREALTGLPGWTHEDDRLKKTFELGGFKEALSFIVRLGMHAEELNHHPEIFNVYNTVKIALNTHDAGGKVTARDVKLASTIESFNWIKPKP